MIPRARRFPWVGTGPALAACLILSLDTPAAAEVEGEGILLMTSYKWSGLSDGQRGLYVKSFLETTSFAMYRKDPPQQAQRDFAAWTACAETVPVERWQPLGWMIKGELKRSAASQFLEVAPLVCKDALPKLDKTLRLVRLISRSTWQSLGLRDRAIYMMGYVETVYEISRTMKRSDELRHLDICIGHVGIEGLMDALGTIDMEWQYPLPWSISRALGKACRPYR